MDELKACPFCGSSNTTLDYYEISCPQELGTIVVCNDCGASAKSIVDWNTRPIEDALQARIAELEYQLEDWTNNGWAEDYKARIAELEAFIDRLIELGEWGVTGMEILTSFSGGEIHDLAERRQNEWLTLVKDWKERER